MINELKGCEYCDSSRGFVKWLIAAQDDQKHSLTVNIAGDKLGAECSDLTSSERLDVFDWIVSSSGESRNSTVNTVIFGVSVVALVFLRLFKVL